MLFRSKGGYRLATSVDGALTGEGGSIIIVDDPHNANEVESDLVRQGTLEWWDQSMSTRLNDPKTGAYIVIMQRLHENDLTGHVLSKDTGNWVHLCLPMRYEADRHCITKWYSDKRFEEGELLVPQRLDMSRFVNWKHLLVLLRQLGNSSKGQNQRAGELYGEIGGFCGMKKSP